MIGISHAQGDQLPSNDAQASLIPRPLPPAIPNIIAHKSRHVMLDAASSTGSNTSATATLFLHSLLLFCLRGPIVQCSNAERTNGRLSTLTESSLLPQLQPLEYVNTKFLNVNYYNSGPSDEPVIVLVQGSPYDTNVYVDVVLMLREQNYRVVLPAWLWRNDFSLPINSS